MRTLNPAIAQAFCWWLCGLLQTSFVACIPVARQFTPIFISRGAVGIFHFQSVHYTALSTLFGWLWMWAARAARQCVCDLGVGFEIVHEGYLSTGTSRLFSQIPFNVFQISLSAVSLSCR